jgi:DNA phosphorothioation-associated putative methyltransferase
MGDDGKDAVITNARDNNAPMARIARHRTAIRRTELSKPVRTALEDHLITDRTTVLDYGCGQGDDIRNLSALGVKCTGWDPQFHPTITIHPSDVVNLGYVVNVIEDSQERAAVLKSAWEYTQQALVVAARVDGDSQRRADNAFRDGCVTKLGTFQKFYEQSELREWIEVTLGQAATAAAPGIFYVFRTDEQRHLFVSSRYHRRLKAPTLRTSDVLFEKHKPLFERLMAFFTTRGRLPQSGELPGEEQVLTELGSFRRAFSLVRRITGGEQWDIISRERKKDLLVFLALSMFPKCPELSQFPPLLRQDIKAFFSNFGEARSEAHRLLFSVGKMDLIDCSCKNASLGKLLPDALYVHASAINMLPPELRVYEGCARILIGRVEGATIVKFSRQEPKITYLFYPKFDSDPHPALAASLRVHLQTRKLKYREFSADSNPFILHRKETLVPSDYPSRHKFERLTQSEEESGLFTSPQTIGRRDQWRALLSEKGFRLRGHQLVRCRAL